MKYEGFIAKIGLKQSEPGARRPWKLYSLKLEKADGSEHPWISLGFLDEAPKMQEGQYLSIEAEEKDGRLVAVAGT